MSGRINVLQPKKVWDQEDMSSTITSETIDMTHLGGFSLELNWTTTDIEGVFEIQVSNSGDVWKTIPESQMDIQGTLTVAGVSDNAFLNVWEHQGYKFRIVFTPSTGSDGQIDMVIGGKAL